MKTTLSSLTRSRILPEKELPDAASLVEEGRRLALQHGVGECPFLTHFDISSESEYKKQRMADGILMFHAQVGYRSFDKSRRAYAEIYDRVAAAGYRVDRYGLCLDWSMGYPAAQRANMPRGTGLILSAPGDFAALTQGAPVAPHFGDFVIGTPASLENTKAALAAGSTAIGNLGQYFTFRMPQWHDDVGTTAETIKAISLCAAQPVEVLIHSNLDDGFAALFRDMACGIGAVIIERYVVEELLGGRLSHCYGHVFSEPLTRLAFQRALTRISDTPGSMVYGNTTIFVENEVENYANLASYMLVDVLAQSLSPTGHGLNPVPVTEAIRIPEIGEIVDAHLFANRLALRSEGFRNLFDLKQVDQIVERLVVGGQRFAGRILAGLTDAGVDVRNPFELLLALRRIGAKRLEEVFGPGSPLDGKTRNREPVVRATTVVALEDQARGVVGEIDASERETIRRASLTACVACTDVHEYGKLLVETVLESLNVEIVDAGVSTDPDTVVAQARGVDFLAVSTYCGVALNYVQALRGEMDSARLKMPIFIGGKLNQVPEDSASCMPVDVTRDLQELGVVVCHRIDDLIPELVKLAEAQTNA
ncbi:MAG: cobalamin B12-binding domain-containing protein [bacterium]|nr:cobalamin B12-binding domain-containing protein [bacterium]